MTPHHDTHLLEHGLATLRRDPPHEGQCPGGANNEMAAGTGAQQVRRHPAEPAEAGVEAVAQPLACGFPARCGSGDRRT
jgi:hypothetical protein